MAKECSICHHKIGRLEDNGVISDGDHKEIICYSCWYKLYQLGNAKDIENRQDTLVRDYDSSLGTCIIFIILNIFIGGLLGVVGAIYDLFTRNYVLQNQDILKKE